MEKKYPNDIYDVNPWTYTGMNGFWVSTVSRIEYFDYFLEIMSNAEHVFTIYILSLGTHTYE